MQALDILQGAAIWSQLLLSRAHLRTQGEPYEEVESTMVTLRAEHASLLLPGRLSPIIHLQSEL